MRWSSIDEDAALLRVDLEVVAAGHEALPCSRAMRQDRPRHQEVACQCHVMLTDEAMVLSGEPEDPIVRDDDGSSTLCELKADARVCAISERLDRKAMNEPMASGWMSRGNESRSIEHCVLGGISHLFGGAHQLDLASVRHEDVSAREMPPEECVEDESAHKDELPESARVPECDRQWKKSQTENRALRDQENEVVRIRSGIHENGRQPKCEQPGLWQKRFPRGPGLQARIAKRLECRAAKNHDEQRALHQHTPQCRDGGQSNHARRVVFQSSEARSVQRPGTCEAMERNRADQSENTAAKKGEEASAGRTLVFPLGSDERKKRDGNEISESLQGEELGDDHDHSNNKEASPVIGSQRSCGVPGHQNGGQ